MVVSNNVVGISAEGQADNTGALYIYNKRPNSIIWSFNSKLTPQDSYIGQLFGSPVSLIDSQLVVGTYTESFYIYLMNSTGSWSQQQKLVAVDRYASKSVKSVCSDVASTNGLIALSIKHTNKQRVNVDSVYIFESSTGTSWSLHQKLFSDNDSVVSEYYNDLQLTIYNNDTLYANVIGKNYSSIYIFTITNNSLWTQQQRLLYPEELIVNYTATTNYTSNSTTHRMLYSNISDELNSTYYPTNYPSIYPTNYTSNYSTINPSNNLISNLTYNPTNYPTIIPTIYPTISPSSNLTNYPSINPSSNQTINSTIYPTNYPTSNLTNDPTINPTSYSTSNLTNYPTIYPTSNLTSNSTSNPTGNPFSNITNYPTIYPTSNQTNLPTIYSNSSTSNSSYYPTNAPTIYPTSNPTNYTSNYPTDYPTDYPTSSPTSAPITITSSINRFTNPSIWGGYLIVQGINQLIIYSIYNNDSCIRLQLSDHFNDGWGIGVLTVRAPDITNDTFQPVCGQASPYTVRYCPNQPYDEGTYIIKVYEPTAVPFFWEFSWNVLIESSGEIYYGDYSTRLLVSYNKTSKIFSYVYSENLVSINSTNCFLCETVSFQSWNQLQTIGYSSFFPIDVTGSGYYISTYVGDTLVSIGRVCPFIQSPNKLNQCYQTMYDGLYILRLGEQLGIYNYTPALDSIWTGCNSTGGLKDQLVFRITNGECQTINIFNRSSSCHSLPSTI